MKILKIALLLAGVGFVIFGLYDAFTPNEIVTIGSIDISDTRGFSDQTFGMIGIGVFALIAGFLIKNRR